jgi:hypothetical protein
LVQSWCSSYCELYRKEGKGGFTTEATENTERGGEEEKRRRGEEEKYISLWPLW